jgi:hypothetical protein
MLKLEIVDVLRVVYEDLIKIGSILAIAYIGYVTGNLEKAQGIYY